VDAVNPGLILGGPAGGGWGVGASIAACHYCALLVRRGPFFAFGVCEFTILGFGVGIGSVVVGEGVLIVSGYAGLDLLVGPLLFFGTLGEPIGLREVVELVDIKT